MPRGWLGGDGPLGHLVIQGPSPNTGCFFGRLQLLLSSLIATSI